MGSKEQRKNQHIRRTKRALAKAKARGRSEYIVGRIAQHLKECEAGKPHAPNSERQKARHKNNQAAAKTRKGAAVPAKKETPAATLADAQS